MASSAIKSSEVSFTLRNPIYTYFRFSVKRLPTTKSQNSTTPFGQIEARHCINLALQQYLGLTGAAIAIDILKIDEHTVWLRVPYDDGGAVAAAVSQWSSSNLEMSLKIEGRSSWLGSLITKDKETERIWSLEG